MKPVDNKAKASIEVRILAAGVAVVMFFGVAFEAEALFNTEFAFKRRFLAAFLTLFFLYWVAMFLLAAIAGRWKQWRRRKIRT